MYLHKVSGYLRPSNHFLVSTFPDRYNPIAVFDMSPEASAARVEAMARAMIRHDYFPMTADSYIKAKSATWQAVLGKARAAHNAIFPAHPTDKKGRSED